MAVMLIPSSSVRLRNLVPPQYSLSLSIFSFNSFVPYNSSTFLRMTRTLTSQIYWYEIDLKIVCQTHGKENEGRHPLVSTPFM